MGGDRVQRVSVVCPECGAVGPIASATILTYDAILNGASESPPNVSPATGAALVTIDDVINSMQVDVVFAGLVAPNTAAHIHCCTTVPGTGTAGVATTTPTFTGFPGGVTAGVYHHFFDMNLSSSYNPAFIAGHGGTVAQALADLFAGIAADKAYLNIHSSTFPGGEIRGFLVPCGGTTGNRCEAIPVPEPATLALLGLGLASLGFSRRRQQPIQNQHRGSLGLRIGQALQVIH
jgi:hypothetical protein